VFQKDFNVVEIIDSTAWKCYQRLEKVGRTLLELVETGTTKEYTIEPVYRVFS